MPVRVPHLFLRARSDRRLPVNNRVLCQILTKSNYACQVAFNGVEAITSMKRDPADVVLMDLLMPVMDGVTCTRELRRLGYNCPIVAVSATIN